LADPFVSNRFQQGRAAVALHGIFGRWFDDDADPVAWRRRRGASVQRLLISSENHF